MSTAVCLWLNYLSIYQIPDEPLRVGLYLVPPVRSVRNLAIPLERGTAFRSRWHHQRPFWFSKNIWQFYLLAPPRHSNTFLRFIMSPYLILRFYRFSIMCFSGFIYRGLVVLWLYATLILFVFTLCWWANFCIIVFSWNDIDLTAISRSFKISQFVYSTCVVDVVDKSAYLFVNIL